MGGARSPARGEILASQGRRRAPRAGLLSSGLASGRAGPKAGCRAVPAGAPPTAGAPRGCAGAGRPRGRTARDRACDRVLAARRDADRRLGYLASPAPGNPAGPRCPPGSPGLDGAEPSKPGIPGAAQFLGWAAYPGGAKTSGMRPQGPGQSSGSLPAGPSMRPRKPGRSEGQTGAALAAAQRSPALRAPAVRTAGMDRRPASVGPAGPQRG
jgi:hypothetical protein